MEECRGFEEADDIIFDLEREIALATEKLTREDLQKPKNWEEATDRIVKENLIRADERASLIAKIDGKIGELNDSKSPYGEKALNRSGFNHSEIEDQIKVLIDLKGLLDTEKAITDKGCESIKPMSLPHKRVKGHAEISKGKGVERE